MKKPTPKRKNKAVPVSKRKTAKTSAARGSRKIALKRILVPIDFSEHSKKALLYALPFAREFKASVDLLYVVEPTIYPSDFGFGQVGFPDVEKELHQKAAAELGTLRDDAIPKTVKSRSIVSTGIPFVEITTYAQQEKIDLIIVATHGRTGVEHILFGSTAEKIIRKAPCPVLVVRAEEHDFIDERA